MYKLSIITITKDNYHELRLTNLNIKVILSKFRDQVEWVIVDGSIKKDIEFIDRHADLRNVKYISGKLSGISNAFNEGIEASNGEWLIFINAGDCLINFDILNFFKEISDTIDIIYGISEVFDPVMNSVVAHQGINVNSWPPMKMPFNHQSAFYRKSAFKKYGNFNSGFKLAMDFDHLLRLKINNIIFIKEVVSRFYLGGVSTNAIQVYKEWNKALIDNGHSKFRARLYKMVYILRYRIKKLMFGNG